MPFEYKTDTVTSERELEEAINQWAVKGYEPFTVGMINKKMMLSDTYVPVIVLIVRKVIRRSRKKNEEQA